MRFTLRQLEYFVAAAEEASVKRAADRVHISQPSISAAIAHLERELELQLFVRHHAQGLSLTTAGRSMLRESKLVLRQAEGLLVTAGELRSEMKGHLSVGCMLTLAPMVVPELGQTFMKQHAGVTLSFHEGNHEELQSKLRRVSIDLAISYDLEFADDVEYEPLVELPPHVLVCSRHPWAKRDSVSLRDLDGQPMILLDLAHSRQYFYSIFQSVGLTPNVYARSASPEVVRSMVASDFGFTIANARPRSLTALDGRRVTAVKLEGKHKPMRIGIATLSQARKPKILEVFERHCRELISESGIPGMLPAL